MSHDQYQVLARRWRPLTFEAVVGQAPIVRTLRNALARQRIAHAYLFTGPRGVGKTTTARLLAMGLNCERETAAAEAPGPCAACEACQEIVAGRALDVIEIDGASNRGIDEVRTLRENVRYAPARGRRKVYIIDEVHMLTAPAFNALLKTLEEPPAHVVFILATTEPRELPATILSRCQRFDFRPIAVAEIAGGLRRILDEEVARGGTAVSAEPDAVTLIARAAGGSLRDALSLLDTALAYGEGRVSTEAVRELLGSGGEEAAWGLAEALVRRDAAEALRRIDHAAGEGHDLGLLGGDALEILRRAMLAATLGASPADLTPEEGRRLGALAERGSEDLLLLLKGLVDAEAEMRKSPHPRVDLEVAAVRLCQRPAVQTIEGLLERLERAEAHLRGYGSGAPAPAAPPQGDLLASGEPGRPARPAPAPRPPLSPRAAPPQLAERRPPPPAPAPPDPAPSAEGVWPRIVDEISRLRPMLGHKLAEAVLMSDDGSRLTVSLDNGDPFTQDMLKQYRQQVLEVARRVRPGLREVQFTNAAAPPAAAGTPATSHPTVQAAVELFEGEVTDVRPRGRAPEARDAGASSHASPENGEVT
jgi:DNA polymerase III subunit gamma/tau